MIADLLNRKRDHQPGKDRPISTILVIGVAENDMDISPIHVLSLFSGAGGLELGSKLASPRFKTVCYVEKETYAQAVLMSRIREGKLDNAPIWDDVSTFDGKPWRGRVDCIAGGFPCQDVSVAGKRAGIKDGARSGLWKEFARAIREVRPKCVLVENTPGLLLDGGLGYVLGDLASMGYDAGWFVFSAATVGAPHLRKRVWIIAYPKKISRNVFPDGICLQVTKSSIPAWWSEFELRGCDMQRGIPAENVPPPVIYKSEICGVDDGLAYKLDCIGCCGNGVVPQQSAIAWEKVLKIFEVGEINNERKNV